MHDFLNSGWGDLFLIIAMIFIYSLGQHFGARAGKRDALKEFRKQQKK